MLNFNKYRSSTSCSNCCSFCRYSSKTVPMSPFLAILKNLPYNSPCYQYTLTIKIVLRFCGDQNLLFNIKNIFYEKGNSSHVYR